MRVDLAPARRIEQAEIDAGGVRGEQREVRRPCRPRSPPAARSAVVKSKHACPENAERVRMGDGPGRHMERPHPLSTRRDGRPLRGPTKSCGTTRSTSLRSRRSPSSCSSAPCARRRGIVERARDRGRGRLGVVGVDQQRRVEFVGGARRTATGRERPDRRRAGRPRTPSRRGSCRRASGVTRPTRAMR